MAKNSKYTVTKDTEFVEGVADLTGRTWPDGRPLSEESTDEFTTARANVGGRPSLSSESGASPQVAFRITHGLRQRAERVALSEGRTVSAVAREALEEYVSGR
jgi:hypothetical protein